MLTDPITDYLNRIRNALQAEHEEVKIPASRLKREMTRILKEQGYITDCSVEPARIGEVIKVKLRYTQDRSPVITGMERVSRPGRRRYVAKEDVPRVFGGMGTTVKGPKGELSQSLSRDMKVSIEDGTLTVERPTDRGEHRALHGLTRSLIANMVEGVTDGFERRLEIRGVGYRANLKGKTLEMALGFSHPVAIQAPEGIEFELPQPTEVVVRGIDKQLVGEIAARVRKARPPEPYKGKGVRYAGERVARKVGKRA